MKRWISVLTACMLFIFPTHVQSAGEVGVTYGDAHSNTHITGYHYPYPDGTFNQMAGSCYSMGFMQFMTTGQVFTAGTYQFYTVDDPLDHPHNAARTITTNYGNWTWTTGTKYPTENAGVGSPWRHTILYPSNWQNMVALGGSHNVPINHFVYIKKVSTGEIIVNGKWHQYNIVSNC